MKILILPTKAVTGKGKFQDRLALALHKIGVTVTRNIGDAVDVALHVGRIRHKTNAKKIVLRVGPACIDSRKDYKAINKEKWKSVEQADAIVYQSEYSMKVYRMFVGHPKCPEGIIYNGACPEFYAKVKTAVSPFKYNFLAAQRKWIPQARLKDIVKSFLKADIPQSALWIAGTVEKKRKGKNVYYMGLQNDKDLGRMYKLCDALIHMIYLDAMPNVCVEAMVAGCQVICGDQGGTIELTGEGIIDKPFKFKPVDLKKPPKVNEKALAELLKEKACAQQHPIKIDHIHIDSIARQYLNFFKKVIGE